MKNKRQEEYKTTVTMCAWAMVIILIATIVENLLWL